MEAAVDGCQDDGLCQPRVCGDLGKAFAQGGEGFSLVQHPCNRAAREGVSSSSKQETSGSQLLWGSARRISVLGLFGVTQ